MHNIKEVSGSGWGWGGERLMCVDCVERKRFFVIFIVFSWLRWSPRLVNNYTMNEKNINKMTVIILFVFSLETINFPTKLSHINK